MRWNTPIITPRDVVGGVLVAVIAVALTNFQPWALLSPTSHQPAPLLPLPGLALETLTATPGWHYATRNGVGYAGFAQAHPDGQYTIWVMTRTQSEHLVIGCVDGPSPDGIPERCEPLKFPYKIPLDEAMLHHYLPALAALAGVPVEEYLGLLMFGE